MYNEYIHVDVSGQFSEWGKVAVSAVWLGSFLWIGATKCRRTMMSNNAPVTENNAIVSSALAPSCWVAATCAIIMIIIRALLVHTKLGPPLDLKRAIIVEPLLFCFVAKLLSKILVRYYPASVVVPLHDYPQSKTSTTTLAAEGATPKPKPIDFAQQQQPRVPIYEMFVLLSKSILSSMVLPTKDVSSNQLFRYCPPRITNQQQRNSSSSSAFSLDDRTPRIFYWGSAIGSTVAVTGSLSNFLVTTVCYDEISWWTFFTNLILPACAMWIVLWLEHWFVSSFSSSSFYAHHHHGYQCLQQQQQQQQQHHDDDDGEETNGDDRNSSSAVELHILSDDNHANHDDTLRRSAVSSSSIVYEKAGEDGCNNTKEEMEFSKKTEKEDSDDAHDNGIMDVRETKNEVLFDHDTDEDAARYRENDNNNKPTPEQQIRIVVVVAALTVMGFVAGYYPLMVLIAATICLFWTKRIISGRDTSSGIDDDDAKRLLLFSQIEYGTIIEYASLLVLTGSWNDTWHPQWLLGTLMGGRGGPCEDPTMGYCAYRYALVVLSLGIVVSPFQAVLLLASCYPYFSPFDWVFTAFLVSVSDHVRCRIQQLPYRGGETTTTTTTGFVLLLEITRLLFFSVASVMAGTFLMARFHTAYECSEKLGECGGF